MKSVHSSLRFLLGLVVAASVVTNSNAASTFSLAGDFTYAENTAESLWSFRLDDYANNPPTFLPLLNDNTRDAATLWGTPFASPPLLWSEGGGFWGIGKNLSGVEQSANGVVWAPEEVLLHPKGGASPARLVIAWRAPRSLLVNVQYSFRKAMPCGNGVGYELRTRIGGVDTELVAFNNIGSGITREASGLSFNAGDQLFFRIDSWGDAGCDITGAAIEIIELTGAPEIVSNPIGGTVDEGGTFTFEATANNASGFAWYKDGALLLGAGNTRLVVADAPVAAAGSYVVVATNTSQSVTSAPAVLAVTARPTYASVLLSEPFAGYSGNQNALQYQTGLKVSHSGTSPGWNRAGGGAIHAVDRTGAGNYAAMIWQDNVLTLANGISANESGATYHVDFVAAPATYAEGGQATAETDGIVIDLLRGDNSVLSTYTCQPGEWGSHGFRRFAFQYAGDGSGDVRVRVGPLAASGRFGGSIDNIRVASNFVRQGAPEIVTQPNGGTVAEGLDFTLSVVASGATGYQWWHGSIALSGATESRLTLTDVGAAEAGNYTVFVTNAVGSVMSAPAALIVTGLPSYTTVLLTEDFSGYTGNQNALQYLTGLKISHSGNAPGWSKAGGGAIHAVDRTGAGNYAAMIWQDNVLTRAETIPANEFGATYHVDFVAAPATYSEGSQGTTETDGIVIDILRDDFSVLATFSCLPGVFGSQGFRPFGFQYVGDGSGDVRVRVGPLAPSGHFGGSIDNLRVATDYVSALPPEITAHPAGDTVPEGSDYTFTVSATGLPAYQWTRNGAPIPGATSSSFIIIDVRPHHAGSYAVILTNSVGSVTSSPAILNVTPTPTYADYQEAVLTDNPIHYYPLDDTTGNTAADLGSLATVGGTYLGGFTLAQPSASSLLGKSVRMDGTSGTLVDLGVFHPGDAVTVEAWALLDADARPGWNAVLGRWDGSYEIADNADLGISFATRNAANALGQTFSATRPARQLWHYIVGVFSGGTLTVYVDGIKGQEQTVGGVLRDGGPTPDRVMIGATRDGTSGSAFNWKGFIDEVAIYDSALSLPQIRAHYRMAQPATQTLTIARGDGTAAVSWSAFSPGYVLQSSGDISGPFTNYAGTVQVQGDRFVVSVPTDSAHRFFRLFKP